MLEELEDRLSHGIAAQDLSGLLFHGTGETLEGDLRPGGYDGLFWTADCPAVAQSYIPKTGGSTLYAPPMSYEMELRVRPAPGSFLLMAARQMSGLEPLDVELDQTGWLKSWRLPEDWPTVGEVVEWLGGMGYEPGKTHWALVEKDVIRPAEYRMPGTLIVLPSEGLRFKDLRRGEEGDGMELEYHNHAGFALARDEGYDGVIINDFAQADEGNVGHASWGLFDHALARTPRLLLPCVRSDYKDWETGLTADIERWAAARETVPTMRP